MEKNSLPEFSEIYTSFKNKVYNTALGYLQNQEDAEEVTQDVFVEIHFSISKFENRSSLSTWIYRITVNKSLDFIKHKNRKKRFSIVVSLFDREKDKPAKEESDFIHPGVQLESKENAKILFKAIHKLPESQKTAFLLARVEGLSNKEIAPIMEISVGAVESLLSRAKENLRKELKDFFL